MSADLHERNQDGTIRVPDLTRYSSAYLRRVSDECERIIAQRAEDGVFS